MRAATVGYVAAAGAPLLAVPSLAGGDAIDDSSVHFLLEMALKTPEEVERMRRAERRRLAREKEEKELEEKREKERQKAEVEETIARLTAEFFREHSQASSSTQKKRKKRKKKKLPRGGRAHRRQRLWHVRALRAVFPSFGGKPRCLAFWWPRSSLTLAAAYAELVLLVFHLALCSILSFAGPRCSASWPVWTRRTVVLGGFAGDDSSRAVFLFCLHAQDARHFGRYGPEGQFRWGFAGDDTSRAVFLFLVFISMMLGIVAGMALVDSCIGEYRKIGLFWEMTSFVSVFGSLVRQWIHIYVSLQWPGLWFRLQKTADSPQLQVIVGRRISCSGGETVSHDHRNSPVAPQHGDRCPCCIGRAGQDFFCCPLYLAVTCTVFGVRLWSTGVWTFLGGLRVLHSLVR